MIQAAQEEDMAATHRNIYSDDPRNIASYPLAAVARYLRIPETTLRSWVFGRRYPVDQGRRTKRWPGLIRIADPSSALLSFTNVIELFVLDSLRRKFQLKIPNVRAGIQYLEEQLGRQHPLATENMETDGCDLFVEYLGNLINVSQQGQHAMRELLSAYLRRVEYDKAGLATAVYPFVVRAGDSDQPRRIMINPLFGFGRPVISGTGIRTEIISERFGAGESIPDLAEDYDRPTEDIEEAIRYETAAA